MPHALLLAQDDGGVTLPTVGGTVYLPQYRLRAWVRLGREFVLRQAVLDTGAPACLLARRVWVPFHSRGEIAWAAHPPGAGTDVGVLPRTTVLGAQHPYRLGRLSLQLADLGDGRLAARDVLAMCVEDGTSPMPHPLIIGLAEVMNGRSLLLQVSESGARWVALVTEP